MTPVREALGKLLEGAVGGFHRGGNRIQPALVRIEAYIFRKRELDQMHVGFEEVRERRGCRRIRTIRRCHA